MLADLFLEVANIIYGYALIQILSKYSSLPLDFRLAFTGPPHDKCFETFDLFFGSRQLNRQTMLIKLS